MVVKLEAEIKHEMGQHDYVANSHVLFRFRFHVDRISYVCMRAQLACWFFWRTSVLFVKPLIPLFWTSDDVSSGFQRQSGSLTIVLRRLYAMDSSDSPPARHLLTSWRQGHFDPRTYVQLTCKTKTRLCTYVSVIDMHSSLDGNWNRLNDRWYIIKMRN